ncbi:MAG: hypothetical protein H6843_13805 [Rhodospirillaceae bacterium]|nr:hypothetical protein [Rhodospirillaceae bacterium]
MVATVTPVEGIDVSVYQQRIDWAQVAQAGIRFAFIRASYSKSTDERVRENWQGAADHGILRGAYHFFRFGRNPLTQAEVFLEALAGGGATYGRGDLPPVLDLEWDRWGVYPGTPELQAAYVRDVRTWLDTVAAALGKTPMVYSNRTYWWEIGNPDSLNGFPFWVAHWGVSWPTSIPEAWDDWLFWQYSAGGTVPGISGPVDLDRFQGGAAALEAITRP